MDSKQNSPDGRIEISVVGSPEVYGGEQSTPGNQSSEHEEQSIEKNGQTPINTEIVIIETGEAAHQEQTGATVHDQLKMWQWVFIDNMQLPALIRGSELLLAVHNVQLKLLSRFPPGLSKEVLTKYTMVSHKMTAMEAWTLNSINAVLRKCELGCQLFTPDDEVVTLRDVEVFYWNVKSINLAYMIQRYEEEINKAHENIALMAVIQAIKCNVEAEIEECKVNILRLNPENGLAAHSVSTRASPHPNSQEATEQRQDLYS